MTEEKTLADMFNMKFDENGKLTQFDSSIETNVGRKLNRKERRWRDKILRRAKKHENKNSV